MRAHEATLYESLSVRAPSQADPRRTDETKAVETIDADAALLDLMGQTSGGLLASRSETAPRGRDGETRITATVETIDPDREAMWLAPAPWS